MMTRTLVCLLAFCCAIARAQRQDWMPHCACESVEAIEANREGLDAHAERRLKEASEAYDEALKLVPPREPTAAETALILRFAPRVYTHARDPFPLRDAAAVLHPNGQWIAYHFFWEDDIDFPDDNDPCDHELMWVRLDPGRQRVVAVYTYFHGRVLKAPSADNPRPRVVTQWGKHGTMPWDWKSLTITADDGDVEKANLAGGEQTLEAYNRATWAKLSSVGRQSQGSPLARGWPMRFEGTWENFTSFTKLVDPVPLLRRRGYLKVSVLNNAVINRHFLRYNFAAKTEWPADLCYGASSPSGQ